MPEFTWYLVVSVLAWLLAIPVLIKLTRWFGRFLAKRTNPSVALLIEKMLRYCGLIVIALAIIATFGQPILPMITALGVVGVAVGFASQTSLSNVISGFFLLSDPPFAIGDLVRIEGQLGIVHSIDLLCVRLRTFDNQLVRIPNETVLKGMVANITAFPIRRVDIDVRIAYKENPEQTRDLLKDLADKHPLCLSEPEPLWLFRNFGVSGQEFLFAVWCQKEDWLTVKNDMMLGIKRTLDEHGIEIPFPHLTLYRGEASPPFELRQVGAEQPTANP